MCGALRSLAGGKHRGSVTGHFYWIPQFSDTVDVDLHPKFPPFGCRVAPLSRPGLPQPLQIVVATEGASSWVLAPGVPAGPPDANTSSPELGSKQHAPGSSQQLLLTASPDLCFQILQSLAAPTKTLEPQVNHGQQGHANAALLSQARVTPEPHLSPPPPPPAPPPVLHLPPQQALQLQQQPYPPPPPHPFRPPPQAHQPQFPPQQQALQHQLAHLQQLQRLHQQQMQTQAPQALPCQPQHQLFGHDPAVEIPEEGFLLGCVFAVADYPEQMSDKQLLATWKRIIQAHGGAVDPTFSSRCTHLLCESQVSGLFAQAVKERKRCVTAHWLNTVLKKKRLVPPHRALHFPVAFPPGGRPCSQHIISVTGFVDRDRDDLKLMAYLAGAKYTGYLCRSNTVLICKE
ncbi:hypothetical protein J1605_016064 [Eschrichtius robustus]|uniref:PAX-interacting protein 1 n=1 Tax=Eschrichtius robustus TaxID=9764 RepID=A0AB34G9K8_ESCRO|nr:hypothetical protein J1605_016064 [Eschrichtius robustus]